MHVALLVIRMFATVILSKPISLVEHPHPVVVWGHRCLATSQTSKQTSWWGELWMLLAYKYHGFSILRSLMQ